MNQTRPRFGASADSFSFVFFYSNQQTHSRRNYCTKHIFVPPFSSSQRKDFFLLLLRNKVAILLHCLYKPSRILIFFLKESRALSFLAISINLESLTRRQGLEKCLVVYILMHERRTRGGQGNWKLEIRWKYPGFLFMFRRIYNFSSPALLFFTVHLVVVCRLGGDRTTVTTVRFLSGPPSSTWPLLDAQQVWLPCNLTLVKKNAYFGACLLPLTSSYLT